MFHVHQTSLGSLGQVKMSLNDNGEQPNIRLSGLYSKVSCFNHRLDAYLLCQIRLHALILYHIHDRPSQVLLAARR
jgi:hypothetical protein